MDIENLYPPVRIQDVSENSAPRAAAASLLSRIVINPPYLPASVLSQDVIRRHNILDLSPEDAEDYLVTDCYPSHHDNVPAKTIQLLRLLQAQVEQLDAFYASGDPDVLLHNIRYQYPEVDSLLVAVDVGDSKQQIEPLLTLYLRLEGREDDEAAFKYDNLLPADVKTGHYFSSIADARQHQGSSAITSQRPNSRLSFKEPHIPEKNRKISAASHGSAATSAASFHTASGGPSPGLQTPSSVVAEDGDSIEQQQQQQAAAGAGEYFTSADDFWAGVADDEDEAKDKAGNASNDTIRADPVLTSQDAQNKSQDDEDRYWAMYDQQEAYNEQDHGRRGRGSDLLSAGNGSRLRGPGSVAMTDNTALATRDEHGTTHATATDTSDSESTPSDAPMPADEERLDIRGASNVDQTIPEEKEKDEEKQVSELGDRPEEEQGSMKGIADEETNKNATIDGRRVSHPPAPESVGGLSYYETPAGMSLNDIERFYREKEMHEKAKVRERLQRAIYGDAAGGDDRSKEPSAGKLPGLIPESTSQKGSNRSKQRRDPIDALAFAESDVFVSEEPNKKDKAAIPQSASMDTLRKLAEQQQKEGKDLRGNVDADAASSVAGSRAGGFKNFLQMAPSVVTDSSDMMDTQSVAGTSAVRVPASVNEADEDNVDDDVDKLSTKTEHSDRTQHSGASQRSTRSHHSNSDSNIVVNKSSLLRAREEARDGRPVSQTVSAGAPIPNRSGAQINSMEDLEAFLFPGRASQKEKEEEEKQRKEEIEKQRKEKEDAKKTEFRRSGEKGRARIAEGVKSPGHRAESVAPSDTFLPGASTDASTHPINAVKTSEQLPSSPNLSREANVSATDSPSLEGGSTSTNLGDVQHSAKNNARRPTAANLMQQHLREQRQQALQMQRERQQSRRRQTNSSAASKAVKVGGVQVGERKDDDESSRGAGAFPSTTDASTSPSNGIFSHKEEDEEEDGEENVQEDEVPSSEDEESDKEKDEDGGERAAHSLTKDHGDAKSDEEGASNKNDGAEDKKAAESGQSRPSMPARQISAFSTASSQPFNAQLAAENHVSQDTGPNAAVIEEEPELDGQDDKELPNGASSSASEEGEDEEEGKDDDEDKDDRDHSGVAPSGLPGVLPFAHEDPESASEAPEVKSPVRILPPLPKDDQSSVDISPAQATNGYGQENDERESRTPAYIRLAEYQDKVQEYSDPSDDGEEDEEDAQENVRNKAAVMSPLEPLPPSAAADPFIVRPPGPSKEAARRAPSNERASVAQSRRAPEQTNGAQQQDRANAARLAKRRREYAQGIKARNEAVKMILKGAWRLMDETAAAMEGSSTKDGIERMGESEFLRLAREAVREGLNEKRSAFS